MPGERSRPKSFLRNRPARPATCGTDRPWLRASIVGSVLLGAAACATARFVPPTGTPVPRADGVSLWAAAARSCQDLDAFGAELGASGRVDGNRVSGLRLGTAFDRDGHLAIEARVSGTPVFSVRGDADSATLVLHQERQTATGRPEDVLGALVGLPLSPERLMRVLAGCVSAGPAVSAESIGGLVRVRLADSDVYLAESHGEWHVRAGTFGDVAVDYRRADGPWPQRVGLTTVPGRTPVVELSLRIEVVSLERRDPSVFRPTVPAGAERITLEWLRENGPMGRRN